MLVNCVYNVVGKLFFFFSHSDVYIGEGSLTPKQGYVLQAGLIGLSKDPG